MSNDPKKPRVDLSGLVGDDEQVKNLTAKIDWQRPITEEEVAYLLSRYPFLQILNSEASFAEDRDAKFILSKSGWLIHDFGDALCSSPGKFLFGASGKSVLLNAKDKDSDEDDDDDGGEGGDKLEKKGTVVNQAFDTAADMVRIATERGWPGIQVVDGHRLMQWAAWMAAEDNGKVILGFEPTEEEQNKRRRIKLSETDVETLRREIRPR